MMNTKYRATIQKGMGDDFLEWEVVIEAENIAKAAAMVHEEALTFNGWAVSIEQDDDAETSENQIER